MFDKVQHEGMGLGEWWGINLVELGFKEGKLMEVGVVIEQNGVSSQFEIGAEELSHKLILII